MSWLVDLAGKAESLLEKVDQTAANALHVEKGVGSDLPSSNANPAPTHAHGSEKSRDKDDDVNPAGKSISKSNVNVTNSKYNYI